MRIFTAVTLLTLAACAPSTTAEEAERLSGIGRNITGLMSWSPQDWVRLADTGCRRGAWDHEVATELAVDALRAQVDLEQPDNLINDDALGGVVWLLTIERCRDRFPEDAIDLGPPGLR